MDVTGNEGTWSFDDQAEGYDKRVGGTTKLYARYDEVLNMVAEIASSAPGNRVLDIGTGTGNLIQHCIAHGAIVVGVDPSEGMLAKAHEKIGNNPNVEFHKIDEPFLDIPYPDACFDAVVSTYAYHHIPDHLKPDSVHEMVRVLKPSGVWVLGDLIFENKETEKDALQEYRWLEDEHFARVEELSPVFEELGMDLNTQQFTPVTWVLWAIRPTDGDK